MREETELLGRQVAATMASEPTLARAMSVASLMAVGGSASVFHELDPTRGIEPSFFEFIAKLRDGAPTDELEILVERVQDSLPSVDEHGNAPAWLAEVAASGVAIAFAVARATTAARRGAELEALMVHIDDILDYAASHHLELTEASNAAELAIDSHELWKIEAHRRQRALILAGTGAVAPVAGAELEALAEPTRTALFPFFQAIAGSAG